MKSLKSRYSLTQINNNNYQTIVVGNKSESALEAGYIWLPYIISQSPNIIIEQHIKENRKQTIKAIIDKL